MMRQLQKRRELERRIHGIVRQYPDFLNNNDVWTYLNTTLFQLALRQAIPVL